VGAELVVQVPGVRNQRLALTPPELVQAHLNMDDATTSAVTAYKGTPLIIR
jgi:hypothetical protein